MSDPDLFLYNLNIEGLHDDVEQSLREAVRCFRHELYLACLAMLSRASEGAWIELGLKLAEAIPSDMQKPAEKDQKDTSGPLCRHWKEDPGRRFVFTSELTCFDHIYKESRVKAQDLRNAVVWADAVRESRKYNGPHKLDRGLRLRSLPWRV